MNSRLNSTQYTKLMLPIQIPLIYYWMKLLNLHLSKHINYSISPAISITGALRDETSELFICHLLQH